MKNTKKGVDNGIFFKQLLPDPEQLEKIKKVKVVPFEMESLISW